MCLKEQMFWLGLTVARVFVHKVILRYWSMKGNDECVLGFLPCVSRGVCIAVRPPLWAVLLIVTAYIWALHLSASSTSTKCLCHQQSLAQPRAKEMAASGDSCKELKDGPHCMAEERWWCLKFLWCLWHKFKFLIVAAVEQ